MKKLILLIILLTISNLVYSQTAQTYSNYSRYMYPTFTFNTGISFSTTFTKRQTPMVCFGMNLFMFMVEYNTDRFTRVVDGFTVQQVNLGYSFGFKNGSSGDRNNKNYLTIYGGKFWEITDLGNTLQDKYVIGLKINSDLRNKFHVWGKIDSNLTMGIGVGLKLTRTNPLFKTTRNNKSNKYRKSW